MPVNFYQRRTRLLQVKANITDTKIYWLYGDAIARRQYNTRKFRT